MVLSFVPNDVHAVPAIPILAIPSPHWDEVIVISSDEEYSSDDEKDDIPEDDVFPAVPDVPTIPTPHWDDIIFISSDEEHEMPAKKAISARNTNSPIDVHVDVEQRAAATMAQMDRIWVDLVRKEIKTLLEIIDSAEH
nr:hypothetical protein [Tanacetum cinerariifolium]